MLVRNPPDVFLSCDVSPVGKPPTITLRWARSRTTGRGRYLRETVLSMDNARQLLAELIDAMAWHGDEEATAIQMATVYGASPVVEPEVVGYFEEVRS